MDMSMDTSPDIAAMWWSIGAALLLVGCASAASVFRRRRGKGGIGCLVLVFLALAAIAAWNAWESYFPPCPRNMLCWARDGELCRANAVSSAELSLAVFVSKTWWAARSCERRAHSPIPVILSDGRAGPRGAKDRRANHGASSRPARRSFAPFRTPTPRSG